MDIPSLNSTLNVWTSNTQAKPYPKLDGDLSADVVIIGGGITGLSTASCLAAQNRRVVLLEAETVGSGTTGSSTGNLYAPVDKYLQSIRSKHGDEVLEAVVSSRLAAIARIKEWITEHAIDCDQQQAPWHLFTTQADSAMDEVVSHELEAGRRAGLPVTPVVPVDFPYHDVSVLTTVQDQMQINPLKYAQALAAATQCENLQIFEHTRATGIEDGDPCTVITDHGRVTAGSVVVATHTPKGIYAVHAEMEARREYVLTAKLRGPLPAPGMYWHLMSGQHYSVRPYSNETGNFLLALGGSHLVGTNTDNESKLGALQDYLSSHFDVESIVYSWAAQNYSAADGLPYIGTSPMQKHVYIATGFAADGLVYGTLSGMLICDAILGRENVWHKLYKPGRFTPRASASGVAKENLNVARHLLKDYLFYGEAKALQEVLPGEGKTMKLDGERVAVHRDDAGQLHIVSSVCTHMGCIVHWNSGEKSWDCPCHGSRFSIDGTVLEGPAFRNLAAPQP